MSLVNCGELTMWYWASISWAFGASYQQFSVLFCRLVHGFEAVAFLIIALFLPYFRPAGLVPPAILLRVHYFPLPLISSLPFPPKERQPKFTSVSAILALDET